MPAYESNSIIDNSFAVDGCPGSYAFAHFVWMVAFAIEKVDSPVPSGMSALLSG